MGVPAGDTCVLLATGSAKNVHLPVLELPDSKHGYQFSDQALLNISLRQGQSIPGSL